MCADGYFGVCSKPCLETVSVLFASAKRTKKQTGLRPATRRFKTFAGYYILSFGGSDRLLLALLKGCFYVLNRCERATEVQTQDCYFFEKNGQVQAHRGRFLMKFAVALYIWLVRKAKFYRQTKCLRNFDALYFARIANFQFLFESLIEF